jgi:hypothetical protein
MESDLDYGIHPSSEINPAKAIFRTPKKEEK